MRVVNILREELQRLMNPERVPVEERRRIVRQAKRAAKRGQNPRAVIGKLLFK